MSESALAAPTGRGWTPPGLRWVQPRRPGRQKGERDLPAREQRRRALIAERAERRRLPWLVAAGVLALGTVSWGTGLAAGYISPEARMITSSIWAVAPVLAAITVIAATHVDSARWWIDSLAAALYAAGFVWLAGVFGPSWEMAGLGLAGVLVCGGRWWLAHPVGPKTPAIDPDAPPAWAPEHLRPPRQQVSAPSSSGDPFVAAWEANNATDKGKAPNSTLTGRSETEHTISYTVELARGQHTYDHLIAHTDTLAGGLGEPAGRVLFEGLPDAPPNRARMTIITNDPVAETRLYTEPAVTATRREGIIHGLARYVDGGGDVDVTAWNGEGTVPTAIIGKTGGGKSGIANTVSVGALHTGLLNLAYIDPKGNSSSALRRKARLALIGPEAASRAPEVINAIMEARRSYTSQQGIDKLKPSAELPGWMLLHDEFSELVNRGYTSAARAWCSIVNTTRSLGIWPIALSQAMQMAKWGDDQTRSAFATQMIVTRMKTDSDNLVPGLEYRPHNLPAKPGMAVYSYEEAARDNVPVRWDFLPSDSDAEDMDEPPPHTTTSALDAYAAQPELAEIDHDALVALIGEPVGGQWIIGPGGTHSLPEADKPVSSPSPTLSKGTGFGMKSSPQPEQDAEESGDESELSATEQELLDLIRGGCTATGDLVAASSVGKSATHDALARLKQAGRITKSRHGQYQAVED